MYIIYIVILTIVFSPHFDLLFSRNLIFLRVTFTFWCKNSYYSKKNHNQFSLLGIIHDIDISDPYFEASSSIMMNLLNDQP